VRRLGRDVAQYGWTPGCLAVCRFQPKFGHMVIKHRGQCPYVTPDAQGVRNRCSLSQRISDGLERCTDPVNIIRVTTYDVSPDGGYGAPRLKIVYFPSELGIRSDLY
jgi:hypothetical protein